MKLAMQYKAFEELDKEVTVIQSGIRSTWGQIEKIIPFGYGVNYRIVKKKLLGLESNQFKYCFIRYTPSCRGLIDVLRTIKEKQAGIKIIIEIPTYPYDNEKRDLKSQPSRWRDRLYRRKLKNYVDLIITPSHIEGDRIFGVKAFEITNGIDVNSMLPRIQKPKDDGVIVLIGVALVTERQGYDRVINGIYNYYGSKRQTDPDVVFYIIGEGDYIKELETLCNKLDISNRVIFTGRKNTDELEYYYGIADIGVGALGTHRTKELKKVNSLKTREYCSKGLPFVVAESDYVFYEANLDFCLNVDDTDEAISIYECIGFLDSLKRKYSDTEIVDSMRNFAEENASWMKILGDVLRVLDKGC